MILPYDREKNKDFKKWEILELKQVDSTNLYLMRNKELLKKPFTVVYAKNQTAGKGRLGRNYFSLPNRHLTFSCVLHPNFKRKEIQKLSLIAGLAVSRVLEKRIKGVSLKWPNDILIKGLKICGILVESTIIEEIDTPVVIIGIGLNTDGKSSEFPSKIRNKITTLEECGLKIGRKLILYEILFQLRKILEEFKNDNIENLNEEWLKKSEVLGKEVICTNGKEKKGIFESLSKEGFPVIRMKNGNVHIHISGDIKLIRNSFK